MGKNKLKIADLARKAGLHRNTITLPYKEEAIRVELEAMERLRQYFSCKVEGLNEAFENE